jgi:glycosyltransferase involved in cell wall biosynthesis
VTPLSVLLVGDYPPDPTLGSSKVFYKLREEFQALGHRCDIVFGDEIGAPRMRHIGQTIAPWRAARAIARRTGKTPYDVIDAASAEGLWIGLLKRIGGYRRTALICRSNGLEHLNYRRMIDDHHAGLTRKGWTRRIWYPLTRLSQVQAAARAADRLLLLNGVDRQFALDEGWQPADRIDVVPHGVSARFLAEPEAADTRARGDGLLFCATWDHTKGIAYLVDAFERLHARGRALPLTILGPGVPAERVLQAFNERVRPFVRVIARVPEDAVIAAYRSHDVFLWTSTYEGFGLALLEAMSQQVPVVSTPVGCARALLRDGVNGLAVPPRDPDAIVSAVERLMDDPSLRSRLGRAARATVSGMTWQATALKTIDVYTRAREGLR